MHLPDNVEPDDPRASWNQCEHRCTCGGYATIENAERTVYSCGLVLSADAQTVLGACRRGYGEA